MTLFIATTVFPVIDAGAVNKIKKSNFVLKTEVRKPITFTNYDNDDVLDQNQSEYCGWGWTTWGEDFRMAQSFKPTLNMITRVELFLYLVGTPGKLEISIRSELSGPDLTTITIDGTDISGSQEHWAEFDFPDIGVEPEQTYYIIWSTIDTDSTNYFVWCFGDYNPYDRGDAYTYSPTAGWQINEGTTNHPDIDFCFKTYGVHNEPPNLQTCRYDKNSDELIISASDIEGDKIRYGVSWNNDENVDEWTILYGSSVEVRINCNGRTGTVGVIAEDEHGAKSNWVSVKSKAKTYINIQYNRLFDQYSLLFSLLRQIIKF